MFYRMWFCDAVVSVVFFSFGDLGDEYFACCVFLCINICWTPRMMLKPKPERLGF